MSGLALNTLSHSYMIHIRSKDCRELTEGFNTDLQVNLEAEIKKTNQNQDIHISLSSGEIPITYYNFSSNLDNLNIYVDGSASLVITEGNYDIYELVDLITADATFPYSASYNENKGKITLTNTDATEHIINFSQTNSRGLSKALGFEREDETVASGGTTTSDGVINLQTIHTIFLHTDLGTSNVITSEKGNYESILDKIPVKVSPFEIIHYNPYDTAPFTTVLTNDAISNFRLTLRDQNGKLLQMNDVRYELSLLVEIHNNKEPAPPPSRGRRTLVSEEREQIVENIQQRPTQSQDITTTPVIPIQSVMPQLPPQPIIQSQPVIQPKSQPQPQSQPKSQPIEIPPKNEDRLTEEEINQQAELTDALLTATLLDI